MATKPELEVLVKQLRADNAALLDMITAIGETILAPQPATSADEKNWHRAQRDIAISIRVYCNTAVTLGPTDRLGGDIRKAAAQDLQDWPYDAMPTCKCSHLQTSHWEIAEPDGERKGCSHLGCRCVQYQQLLPSGDRAAS